MRLTKIERSYMAGIMDGEGSFTVSYNVRFRAFIHDIGFCQVQKLLPKQFQDAFGGSLRRIDRKGKKFKNHRPIWRWRIYGHKNSKRFLKTVIPYLRLKKHQAILCLEFHSLGRQWSTKRRHQIVKILHRLNKRGRIPRG
jgi:hypothetical protein